MVSAEDVEEILRIGHETRGTEFKGPGARTDSYFFAKIARAALSLGNRRDGGYIIVGIDDQDPSALLPGLDADQLESWTDYDNVSAQLARYADPPLQFDIDAVTLSSDGTVIVIQVHEFAEVPHLCARAYEGVLRRGALYVRAHRMPETAEVAGFVEMREILDLATQKGVRRFVQTAVRAGLHLGSGSAEQVEPTDDERFGQERERGWS